MNQHIPDYLQWFGFSESPFRMSPDLDFFFPSKAHKQAMDILKYGIGRGEGFMVLSGQAGTGKTMLLRLLLQELPEDRQAAFIVTPAVSPKGLMSLLLEELDIHIPPERSELALMLKDFQDHVIQKARNGKGILIVIDEAQDLPIETVEQLRLLSNIETGKKKLVQILLVGQPELRSLISDPRLCQLTQRIVINETLEPLGEEETADYVRFRIAKAGRPDLRISRAFLGRLHRRTRGLPRLINRAMDRALLMAAASGAHMLDTSHLDDALSTLPEPSFQYESRRFSPAFHGSLRRNLAYLCFGCGTGAAMCLLLFALHLVPSFEKTVQAQHERVESRAVFHERSGFPVKISVSSAKIHSQPAKSSSVVTKARQGHRLFVLEERGRWYRVRTTGDDGESLTGWLLKKQVERGYSAVNTFSKKQMDSPEDQRRTI